MLDEGDTVFLGSSITAASCIEDFVQLQCHHPHCERIQIDTAGPGIEHQAARLLRQYHGSTFSLAVADFTEDCRCLLGKCYIPGHSGPPPSSPGEICYPSSKDGGDNGEILCRCGGRLVKEGDIPPPPPPPYGESGQGGAAGGGGRWDIGGGDLMGGRLLPQFQKRNMNIVDPLNSLNNLGRSVSTANFYRIIDSFRRGSAVLESVVGKCDDIHKNNWLVLQRAMTRGDSRRSFVTPFVLSGHLTRA